MFVNIQIVIVTIFYSSYNIFYAFHLKIGKILQKIVLRILFLSFIALYEE